MATSQYNIETVFKQGEVGKVINFTCRDADGLVDLTNYTMTLNVTQGSTVVLDDVSVTKYTQSGATLGKCKHTLTITTAAISPGTYKGEIKATYGSNVLYFPCDRNGERTYFKLIVQESLG